MLKTTTSVINASQIATPITLPGNVTLSTGNLVIGTAGKGIDFSVTSSGSGTMTSELLADYEEGTWTPIWAGTTTAGTYIYDIQLGYYTKIGNQVTVWFGLWNINPTSAGTGNAKITGLPFTSKDVFVRSTFAPNLRQGTTVSNNLLGFVPDNASFINFIKDNDAGSDGTFLQVTIADGTLDALGCVTYFV